MITELLKIVVETTNGMITVIAVVVDVALKVK